MGRGFLNIGDKDVDGRQKRIEHKGKYLRVSRTGGVALRAQKKIAGINVTGNTKNGLRLSTRVAKNTQIALQNGRFIFRGRYGPDAAKLNVSKTGVTVSSKTDMGSFNWVKPSRSSFKIAGIQLRGRKAAVLQIGYLFVKLLLVTIRTFFSLLIQAGRGIGNISVWLWNYCFKLYRKVRGLEISESEIRAAGEDLLEREKRNLSEYSKDELYQGLLFVLTVSGRGHSSHSFDCADKPLLRWLVSANNVMDPTQIMGVAFLMGETWGEGVEEPVRIEVLYTLDEACLEEGPKTMLQTEIINSLVSAFKLKFEGISVNDKSDGINTLMERPNDEN